MKSISYYFSALSSLLNQRIAESKDIKSGRKVVIFESDDWGAIRVPSNKVHDELIAKGYNLDSRPYERFDGLEQDKDIEALTQTLSQFSDKRGNHPILTLNYLSANPYFDKIRANNFQYYTWESIDITYKEYSSSARVIELVKEGIGKGVFEVQFHGREHFDILKWLEALQLGDSDVHTAFNYKMCGIFPKNNPAYGNKYMVALKADTDYLMDVLNQGITEFTRIWGHSPQSFIAPCYTWDSAIEVILKDNGIRVIQSSRFQKIPASNRKIIHYTGQKNSLGQMYTVRNCAFEPATTAMTIDVVAKTMAEVRKAFKSGTPAIISTHRINYTSRLSEENAVRSRKLLKELLIEILSEFPDVEFSTGVKLFK